MTDEEVREIEEQVEALARSDAMTKKRYELYGFLYQREEQQTAE